MLIIYVAFLKLSRQYEPVKKKNPKIPQSVMNY